MMSLPLISRARRLLAQETGTIYKPHGGKIRVALAYPNTYWVGMSNLGFQTVYHLLNQRPDTVCERVFLPSPAECQQYKRSRTPLFSLESQTPIRQFDLLAFSVPFEGDYPHILDLLELAGIEPRADRRSPYEPLLIMGGVCSLMNPEPLAPIMDGFVLGEGEEIMSELMNALSEAACAGEDRATLLLRLARIPGFYAPRFYQPYYNPDDTLKEMRPGTGGLAPLELRQLSRLDDWPTHSRIITPHTEFGNMYLVELGRGCVHACRFCLLGFQAGIFRPRSLEAVSRLIESGLEQGKRIGLMGAAITDYPWLAQVCRLICQKGGKLSVASLRADNLPADLLAALKQSGHKTISLAPEAGSQRLRDSIGKGLTEDDILAAVKAVAEQGIPHVKLYFMWGLPGERLEDIKAIAELARRVRQIMSRCNPTGLLSLSLSPFVPKPRTPFQWLGLEPTPSLNHKLNCLRQELRAARGVRLLADSPRWAFYQALFSKGDRRVGETLLSAYKERRSWQAAFKQMQPPAEFFVYRRREATESFPWNHLTGSGLQNRLSREYDHWLASYQP
jgi:radical SAM superfamily enzyme YgiQ (UPF0313 family)